MIKLIIHTGNAAFDEGQKDLEVARILEEVAERVERRNLDLKLYDLNGNSVGRLAEMDDDEELAATGDEFVRLELDTGNAAFEDDGKFSEVARILCVAAEKVRDGDYGFKLRDFNGNTVGRLDCVEPTSGHTDEPPETRYALISGNFKDGFTIRVIAAADIANALAQSRGGESWAQVVELIDPVADSTLGCSNTAFAADPEGEVLVAFGSVGGGLTVYGPFPEGGVAAEFADTYLEDNDYEIFSPEEPNKAALFGYYINLDERGSFYADVRDEKGKTVFEIKAGNELEEDETSIFDDGYMKHKNDLTGLHGYLVELGIITQRDKLLDSADFERALSQSSDADDSFEP